MRTMETDEFLNRFQQILTETWKLVKRKNEQYSTNDALANFTTGAELQYHDKSPEWQFETLKDYMLKHIAHVYNNRLMGNGVRESLGDIATYCIIGMIMHDAIDTRQPENEKAFFGIDCSETDFPPIELPKEIEVYVDGETKITYVRQERGDLK